MMLSCREGGNAECKSFENQPPLPVQSGNKEGVSGVGNFEWFVSECFNAARMCHRKLGVDDAGAEW